MAAGPWVAKELHAEGRLVEVDRSISVTDGEHGSDLSHRLFTPSIKDISRLLDSLWKISPSDSNAETGELEAARSSMSGQANQDLAV
jgi:hypothetical protein